MPITWSWQKNLYIVQSAECHGVPGGRDGACVVDVLDVDLNQLSAEVGSSLVDLKHLSAEVGTSLVDLKHLSAEVGTSLVDQVTET